MLLWPKQHFVAQEKLAWGSPKIIKKSRSAILQRGLCYSGSAVKLRLQCLSKNIWLSGIWPLKLKTYPTLSCFVLPCLSENVYLVNRTPRQWRVAILNLRRCRGGCSGAKAGDVMKHPRYGHDKHSLAHMCVWFLHSYSAGVFVLIWLLEMLFVPVSRGLFW